MAIIHLQRSVRQVGRIRLGEQVASANGNKRPVKLASFRLTSPQRGPIDKAADLYGGQVSPFDNDRSDDRWQVTTEADSIPVVIPPTHHLDQWMESWAGSGCDRRCDGERMIVADGRAVDQACMCDPDNRSCKITTRLWVVLPELEALGVWRVETHGWYAATELAGAADLCAAVTAQGRAIPARLDLEQRTRRTKDHNGKPQTYRFAVPVLSVDVSIPQARQILGQVDTATGEITGPAPRQLAAVPEPRQLEVRVPVKPAAAPVDLPPPPAATIPTPRTADEYEAAQDEPDVERVTPDEVAFISAMFNDIEDDAARKAVKVRFVSAFGKPDDLVRGLFDDAQEWVANEIAEARHADPDPVEVVDQPKLLDVPAEPDHTPTIANGDRAPSAAAKKKALALIGQLVSDPGHPDITSSDDYRHDTIHRVTAGRTNSIRDITSAELDLLIGDLQALIEGRV